MLRLTRASALFALLVLSAAQTQCQNDTILFEKLSYINASISTRMLQQTGDRQVPFSTLVLSNPYRDFYDRVLSDHPIS